MNKNKYGICWACCGTWFLLSSFWLSCFLNILQCAYLTFQEETTNLFQKKCFPSQQFLWSLQGLYAGRGGSSEQVPSCLTCLGETEADRRKGAGKGTSSQPTVRSCKRSYSRGDAGIFLSLLERELHPGRLENEWVHVSINDEWSKMSCGETK